MSSPESTPHDSPTNTKAHSSVMSVDNILLMERPHSTENADKRGTKTKIEDTSDGLGQQQTHKDETRQSPGGKEEEEVESQLAAPVKADSPRSMSPNMVQNEPPKKKRKKASKQTVEQTSLETTPAPDPVPEPVKKRKRTTKKTPASKSRKTSGDQSAQDDANDHSRPPSSESNHSALPAQPQAGIMYPTGPNGNMYGPPGSQQGAHYTHSGHTVHYPPTSLPPMMHQQAPQQYAQYPPSHGWNPYGYHPGYPNVGMGMGYMPPPPPPGTNGVGQYSYMSLPHGAYPYGIPPPTGPYMPGGPTPDATSQSPYGPGPGYSMSPAYPQPPNGPTENVSSNGKGSKPKAERSASINGRSSSKPTTPTQTPAPYQAQDSAKRVVSNGSSGFNSPAQPHAAGAMPVPSAGVLLTDDAMTKVTDRVQRKCFNCGTTDTSTWRRSNLYQGKVLCNKCGLFERTHRRARPDQFVARRGPSDDNADKRPQAGRTDSASSGGTNKPRLKQGTQAVLNVSHDPVSPPVGMMSNQYPHSDLRHDQVAPAPYYGAGPGPAIGGTGMGIISTMPSSASYLRLSSAPVYSGGRNILNTDGDEPADKPETYHSPNYQPGAYDAPQPQTYQQAISNSRDSPSPADAPSAEDPEEK